MAFYEREDLNLRLSEKKGSVVIHSSLFWSFDDELSFAEF